MAELFFFLELGDFSGLDFFFFLDCGDVSSSADFFFAFGVASGVSLGAGDSSAVSLGVFFFFGFGDGVVESEVRAALALDGRFFFFLCADDFAFGEGVGVSSSDVDLTARALRTGGDFSSSVCWA